jgi:archaellum biogenesis ATPase FlaH
MAFKDVEEQLGAETLLSEKAKKLKISSGIREYDEMIGGGFSPASLNLIQESLGCGGDILSYCIARANLNLSNKVLIIYSDPLSRYLVERLKKFDSKLCLENDPSPNNTYTEFKGPGKMCGENLFILDLVALSENDITIMEDKHELQLSVSMAISQMLKAIENSGDDYSEKFIIFFSLNPFLLKLGPSTLDILYNSVIEASKSNYVQLLLMQKNIISQELKAKIQSLCHMVCDLSAKDTEGLTELKIKILKHAGTIHDIKSEPYIIEYDRHLDRYSFLIRGAFLTSFETLRNLLNYQNGSIFLANVPYLIAPVEYFNTLIEAPLNISLEAGKREIHEKSMAIGRRLTNATKGLYYLFDFDLLKATIRQLALFGFGNFEIDVYEKEENLLMVTVSFHKELQDRSYKLFIRGLMEGIIRRSLKRSIRSVRLIKIEKDVIDQEPHKHRYKIIIRLSPMIDED